jgi:predicted membrane-bound spermidine synthase
VIRLNKPLIFRGFRGSVVTMRDGSAIHLDFFMPADFFAFFGYDCGMKFSRIILLVSLFVSGFVIMGMELLGFRLMAVYFGYSNYVQGSQIGVVMLALALGYWIGGRWADRRPDPAILYKAMIGAAAWFWIMAPLYPRMLEQFQMFPIITGTLLSSCILMVPPMILLSMAGPFVIRILAHQDDVGSTAGRIYALSTLGSLLGTFLTPFWAIPTMGARLTYAVLAILIAIPPAVGLFHVRMRKALLALPIAAALLLPHPPPGPDVVANYESAYSDIQILQGRGGYQMAIGIWLASFAVDEGVLAPGMYYDYFGALPVVADPEEILILGMGGGTTARQYLEAFPRAHIDAVEIDPMVVELAGQYFHVKESPRLTIHTQDARPFLARTSKTWDVIQVDLFQHGPHVPFYTVTREFFRSVREHLEPEGMMIMNILAPLGDRTLLDPILATMAEEFPSIYGIPREHNMLVAAFPQERSLPDILRTLEERTPPLFARVAADIKRMIRPVSAPPETMTFTDDYAPVERLQHALLSSFRGKMNVYEKYIERGLNSSY